MVGSVSFTAEYVGTYDIKGCDEEMKGNICCEGAIEAGHVAGLVITAVVL